MRSWSIYAILILSLGLTVSTAFLVYYGETNKISNTNNLLNTHETIHHANQLLAKLQNAQINKQNYLLTDDEQYLAQYQSSVDGVGDQLSLLLSTLPNAESGQKVEDELNSVIIQKVSELRHSITVYEQEGMHAAYDFIIEQEGDQRMKKIQVLLNQLVKSNEELLNNRVQQLNQSYHIYEIITYAGLLLIGVITLVAFITIKKQSAENSKLVKQLQSRNDQLAIRHDQKVELNRAKNKSMNIAAHDLRSPLNAITSISSLVEHEDDKLDKEQKEYWHIVSDAAEQMTTLINNLLDVQKIEEGSSVEPETEMINVFYLVEGITKSFEKQADNKEISIELEANNTDREFCTDKVMFAQIVENLLSNAIKFSPLGSTVIIQLDNKDDYFNIKIIDQGPGIKKSEMGKLFTPYEKLSAKPTGNEKSTGLGLPIVKDRVDTLGGTIDCISEMGEGTIFVVKLPDMGC